MHEREPLRIQGKGSRPRFASRGIGMEPNFDETLKFPDVFFDGRGQGKARNAAQKWDASW